MVEPRTGIKSSKSMIYGSIYDLYYPYTKLQLIPSCGLSMVKVQIFQIYNVSRIRYLKHFACSSLALFTPERR